MSDVYWIQAPCFNPPTLTYTQSILNSFYHTVIENQLTNKRPTCEQATCRTSYNFNISSNFETISHPES